MKKYFKGHFFEFFLHLCTKMPVIPLQLYKNESTFCCFFTCIPLKVPHFEPIIYVYGSQFIAEIPIH
jgi:hypothetical protein